MKFKFANKLDQNSAGQNIGTVPVAALLGGDPSSNEVVTEYGDDYTYVFGYTSSTLQIVSETTGSTGGYISPGTNLSGYSSNLIPFDDIIIGSPDSNMLGVLSQAATGEYIIYDLLTNKVFNDFVINDPDDQNAGIYLAAKDCKDKVLVYRTEDDEERFLTYDHRYHKDSDWEINANGLRIDFLNDDFVTGNQVTISKNPFTKVEALWTDREWNKKWEVHIPKTVQLGTGSAIEIKSNVKRHKYIQNEKIDLLRPRLIKTRHKDWGQSVSGMQLNPENIIYDGSGYVHIKNPNNEWANYTVWDIDMVKGLVLLEDPIKYNMRIDYKINSSNWIPLKETNMNPLKNPQKCFYYIWLRDNGNLYYSFSDAKLLLYPYGSTAQTPVVRTLAYDHIFTIRTVSSDYRAIDIRTRGGEVLDKNNANYDIKSHTTFGYWGYEPTQLNTVLIEFPDVILETMIDQFNEQGASSYGYSLPANIAEARIPILSYIDTFQDENETNLIQNEMTEAVRRYMPLGVSVILSDNAGNILFDTLNNPDQITFSKGLL